MPAVAARASASGATTARPAAPPPSQPSPPRAVREGRYALVSTAAGTPPQYLFEGGTYTLPTRAVSPALSSSRRSLKFDRVVVVRDGARQRASAVGPRASFVPDAWVEAELVEHLDPQHFGGDVALSRFRVTRIVAFGEEEEQVVAAAAASSR
jgi:hypothetical protein